MLMSVDGAGHRRLRPVGRAAFARVGAPIASSPMRQTGAAPGARRAAAASRGAPRLPGARRSPNPS
ncbi:hypothetical protein, partial [Burkholderia pseudomallei]|uniref:hypothetical protein n=1 Tax=Burkholderia pseudomallei TaxID=28450 RepID=UPI001C4AE68A